MDGDNSKHRHLLAEHSKSLVTETRLQRAVLGGCSLQENKTFFVVVENTCIFNFVMEENLT